MYILQQYNIKTFKYLSIYEYNNLFYLIVKIAKIHLTTEITI